MQAWQAGLGLASWTSLAKKYHGIPWNTIREKRSMILYDRWPHQVQLMTKSLNEEQREKDNKSLTIWFKARGSIVSVVKPQGYIYR